MEEELKLFKEEKPEVKYKIKETGEIVSPEWLQKIISVYQGRLKKLSEIADLTDFFFKDKLNYDKNLLRWDQMLDKEIRISLDKSRKMCSRIRGGDWTKENLEKIFLPEAEKFAKEIKKETGDRGYLLWPLRVALSGKEASAGPFEIAEILGKEKTLKRLKEARELIK